MNELQCVAVGLGIGLTLIMIWETTYIGIKNEFQEMADRINAERMNHHMDFMFNIKHWCLQRALLKHHARRMADFSEYMKNKSGGL